MVKRFDTGRGGAGGLGGAQGVAEDGFDFHGAAGGVVELHAGAVGFQLRGVGEHFLDKRLVDGVSAGRCGGGDFAHQGLGESARGGVGYHLGGVGVEHDGEAVEGNVPDQFVPARAPEVRLERDRDSCALEIGSELAKPVAEAAGELGEQDRPVGEMLDVAGTDLVGTEKRQPGQDAFRADVSREFLLGAETVLQEHDGTGRWKQGREEVVLRGLEADEDEVARRQLARLPAGMDAGEREVAIDGFDDETVLADMLVIGV